MATGWISGVDYYNGSISQVRYHETAWTTVNRAHIINRLRAGVQIFTAVKGRDGGLVKGARVEETRGGFITTEGNATTRDNLGSLPSVAAAA